MGLFDEQLARKPNKYPWTDEFIEVFAEVFWTVKEFSFKGDLHEFNTVLTEQERGVIVRALSAIAQIETAVKPFWARLGPNLPHPAIHDLGYVMAESEVRHNRAYEKLLDVLRLDHIFEENLKEPVIKGRVDYLRKYLEKVYKDDKKQYVYALILFTIFVENISLFSQFYIIQWFGRKGILKDTDQQVQYTRVEETLHAQVGFKLIETLREEYPELFDDELINRIRQECMYALIYEGAIIDWIMQGYEAEGLSSSILKTFIYNRLHTSMIQLGIEPIEPVHIGTEEELDSTTWFDIELVGNSKTDFFAKKSKEYGKNNKVYSIDEVFG